MFKRSSVPITQSSSVSMFQCYNVPLVHWSIGPLVQWSIGPLIHWSIGPLDYWFIGPLVECQMLNVNKVNILTEHTSGVPPVIFESAKIVMKMKLHQRASHLLIEFLFFENAKKIL